MKAKMSHKQILNSEPFFVFVGLKLKKEPTQAELWTVFYAMLADLFAQDLIYQECLSKIWEASLETHSAEKHKLEKMIYDNSVGDR